MKIKITAKKETKKSRLIRAIQSASNKARVSVAYLMKYSDMNEDCVRWWISKLQAGSTKNGWLLKPWYGFAYTV